MLQDHKTVQKTDPENAFDAVDEAEVKRAKEEGVKLNKRSKKFVVEINDESKDFVFGSRYGIKPTAALEKAIKEARELKEIQCKVGKWSSQNCTEFFRSVALPQMKHKKLHIRHDMIAAHLWKNPEVKAKFLGTDEPVKDAPPTSSTQQGGAKEANAKETELFKDVSAKPLENQKSVEDVTSSIFRSSSSVDVGTVEDNLEDVNQNTTIILPRVTLVKYLEAVNLWESEKDKVVGEVLAARLDRGKHKGRALVRSLFVGDLASSPDLNTAEHSEWMTLNKGTISVGRHGF